MMQLPVNHLWQFEEIICTAEALPAGDKQLPNKALQLKWFYMSFHSEDCVKYVESGQRLCDQMFESVAEYFENIFNLQVADVSLAKKCEHQIEHRVRHEMCHVLRAIQQEGPTYHGTTSQGWPSPQQAKQHVSLSQLQVEGLQSQWSLAQLQQAQERWQDSFWLRRQGVQALCTDQWEITPLKCATRASRIKTSIKPMTKSVKIRCITLMRITQVMTISRSLVLIRRFQAKIWYQPCWARAKIMRMRIIIFMLIRNWRQVAMCLASLTINSIGAGPSRVKRVKKEKRLLHSWTTIWILWMPS